MQSLTDLLTQELQELLASERYSLEAASEMSAHATSSCFKTALAETQAEARTQIMRLQCAFDALGHSPEETPCNALHCLIGQGLQSIENIEDPALRDALLVSTQQKIEHLQIASYCSARDYALHLGRADVAELLQDTLAEKQKADLHLSLIIKPPVHPSEPTRHSVGSA